MTRVSCSRKECLREINGECLKSNIEINVNGCQSIEEVKNR